MLSEEYPEFELLFVFHAKHTIEQFNIDRFEMLNMEYPKWLNAKSPITHIPLLDLPFLSCIYDSRYRKR